MSETVQPTPLNPAVDEIVDRSFHNKTDWIQMIKDLRAAYGFSLYDAQKMALSHPGWRRWAEARMQTELRCRKQALSNIRQYGPIALIEKRGDRLVVR